MTFRSAPGQPSTATLCTSRLDTELAAAVRPAEVLRPLLPGSLQHCNTRRPMQPCLRAERQCVRTALKAKRARATAGLRTSAAHARWEEIDLGDVAPVIELTKELTEAHLA